VPQGGERRGDGKNRKKGKKVIILAWGDWGKKTIQEQAKQRGDGKLPGPQGGREKKKGNDHMEKGGEVEQIKKKSGEEAKKVSRSSKSS